VQRNLMCPRRRSGTELGASYRVRLMLVFVIACGATQDHPFGPVRWAIGLPVGDTNLEGPALPLAALDPAGDVIVGGSFRGTADFGSGQVATPAQNLEGGWLSKRSGVDGSYVWAITLGTNPGADPTVNNLTIDSIHVDADGNVVVAGEFQGSVDLGGQTLDANGSPFIARYSGDGVLLSAHKTIASNLLALAGDGSMFVGGFCDYTISFPNETDDCGTAQPGTFFAALAPDGTTLWGHLLAGEGHQIALTPSGELVISGTIDKAATLGTYFLDPAAPQSRYVAALDRDGNWLWAEVLDDRGDRAVAGSLTVTNDHIITVGARSNATTSLLAITELDLHGGVQWSTESRSTATARVAAVNPSATTILAGPGGYALDFGGGPLRARIYVAAFGDNGAFVDMRGFGDPGEGIGAISGLVASPKGELVVSGSSLETLDFGTGLVSGSLVAMFDSPRR
jgi:hypothetical protein